MTSTPSPRDAATRKRDALAALESQGAYWLATAEVGGRPHLIAVSGWWDGHDIVFTTLGTSKTARNLAMNPAAKFAGGTPADAVVIEAQMMDSVMVDDAPDVAEGFKKAMGWDPREMDGWMFFRMRPTRIQAFRGYDEIDDRDVMVRSRWVV